MKTLNINTRAKLILLELIIITFIFTIFQLDYLFWIAFQKDGLTNSEIYSLHTPIIAFAVTIIIIIPKLVRAAEYKIKIKHSKKFILFSFIFSCILIKLCTILF